MSSAVGVSLPRLSRSTTTTREILKYAVDGKVPGFTADFIDNYYSGHTSLSSAITHSRSGNAVMTDGYGPELVVNGDFSSGDLTGWTDNSTGSGSVSVVNNTLLLAGTDTSNRGFVTSDSFTTKPNVAYVIELSVTDRQGSGDLQLQFSDVGGNRLDKFPITAKGKYQYTVIAQRTASYLKINCYDDDSVSIDNVSVRAMPVLKWAPHNLLSYSEDWSQWNKSSASTVAATVNSTTAPDGTTTADTLQEASSGSGDGARYWNDYRTVTANQKTTFSVFMKKGTSDYGFLTARHSSNNVAGAEFDLDSGTVDSTNDVGNCTLNDSSITDVGSGWYLCSITFTCTASTTSGFYFIGVGHGTGVSNAGYPQGTLASDTVYAWGAHLYRSDLGGMADNPDQPPSRASYVPTTSSAVYLPRVGHHVYNGSAWVNEGLLAESESRTNKEKYSDFASSIIANNLTVSTDQAVSPDGTENATELTETGANDYHRVYQGANKTGTANSDHTFSAYVKRGSGTRDIQLRGFYLGTGAPYVNFDLGDGTVGSSSGASGTSVSGHTWTLSNTNIQDVGNGWYRVSATVNASSDFTVGFVLIDDASTAIELEVYQGDNTSSVLIYGAQFEAASTPSSLVPTSGSTVTRAAETFTIPSANLPWPEPNYIGSELFSGATYLGNGWTDNGDGSYTSDGSDLGGTGRLNIVNSTVAGTVYYLTMDVSASSIDVRQGGSTIHSNLTTVAVPIVGDSGGGNINITVNGALTVSNISLREINPLSVSIGMEGRITYADEDAGSNAGFFNWQFNSVNYLRFYLSTSGNRLGEPRFEQRESDDGKTTASGASSIFKPDVLTPFDISGRYGSTFVNGAVDGVALTAITTPTALPDLSSSDLTLAYDYMGTISEFRVWDKDIGDAGIVEATNPSLEPSLSLTFEGTGTNSFIVNDWSE